MDQALEQKLDAVDTAREAYMLALRELSDYLAAESKKSTERAERWAKEGGSALRSLDGS